MDSTANGGPSATNLQANKTDIVKCLQYLTNYVQSNMKEMQLFLKATQYQLPMQVGITTNFVLCDIV